MASQFAMQSFYRSTPLTVDTSYAQQKYFEDDAKSVLDENSLEHGTVDSGLEMSPPMANSRRESFAVGSSVFSPKQEDWGSVDMQALPSHTPFTERNGGDDVNAHNPFMRFDQTPGQLFPQHSNQWGISSGSASQTPIQQYNAASAAFDSSTSVFQRFAQTQNPFSHPSNLFGSLDNGDSSMPSSPQKEWMVPTQSMNKKTHSGSPLIRSHNELRRGDGIRKKNARFDIPAERNLSNIDSLISQSTDEQEIKELKQQKRLLRNRQAA